MNRIITPPHTHVKCLEQLHIIKVVRFVCKKFLLSFREKKFKHRLKYIFEDNHSDELLVVFSGFATHIPKYNYMRTLKDSKVDKLFILDDFGYRGSYYWFMNGTDLPLQLTNGLINMIKGKRRYKRLMMAGSSKGGTCAIYYGLEHEADEIFASACQYHVGSYLSSPNHRKVLEGMMGVNASEVDILRLNSMMPVQLDHHAHNKCLIHLCFSKDEHTYYDHIVDLIHDLTENDIHFIEKVDSYTLHDDNGLYFSAYLKQRFCNNS